MKKCTKAICTVTSLPMTVELLALHFVHKYMGLTVAIIVITLDILRSWVVHKQVNNEE